VENQRAISISQHLENGLQIVPPFASIVLSVLLPVVGSGLPQVPQFILEEAEEAGYGAHCRIMVTQPRRIAAISTAERVAWERGERGVGPVSSVGYQVRSPASHLTCYQRLRATSAERLFFGVEVTMEMRRQNGNSLVGVGDPTLFLITSFVIMNIYRLPSRA